MLWEIIIVIGFVTLGCLLHYFAGFHPVVCLVLFGTLMGISLAVVRKMRRVGKKWRIVLGVVWFGFLAFLFFNPISLWVTVGCVAIVRSDRIICTPEVYTPVGETLALYCQSYPLLQSLHKQDDSSYIWLDGAWIPDVLNTVPRLGRGYGYITLFGEDGLDVELGGGFYHYGYLLERDTQASTALTNVWQLYFKSEGTRQDRHLMTFQTDATRQLTADEARAKGIGSDPED